MHEVKKGLREASGLLSKGKVKEALARLMRLTEKYPDDIGVKRAIAAALNQRGVSRAEAGDLNSAATDFDRSLGYYDSPEGHINLGRVHQSHGQFAEAFTEYTKALEMDEDVPEAHESLGYYFLEVGDFDQAVVAFGRAIAKGRTTKTVFLGLWQAFMGLERKSQAHEAILELARREPEDDDVQAALGISWAACIGDLEKAEEALTRALGLNPRHLPALFQLAGLAAVRGRRPEAMAFLKRCVDIDRDQTLAMWKHDLRAPSRHFAAYAGDEDFLDILGVTST